MPRSATPRSQKILDFFEESSLDLAEEILSLCAAKVRERRRADPAPPAAKRAKSTRQYRKNKKQPDAPEAAAE